MESPAKTASKKAVHQPVDNNNNSQDQNMTCEEHSSLKQIFALSMPKGTLLAHLYII